MNIKTHLLAIGLIASSFMSVAQANLINNGDFETGDFTGWTQFDNTGFTGVDSNANSGSFGAFFGPQSSTGGIYQSFATTIGATYTLDFWYSRDELTPHGSSTNSIDVALIDGSILGSQTSVFGNTDLDGSGFGWTALSQQLGTYTFTANSALTFLQFTFRDDASFYHLDDVSVNALVPEPGTLALLAIGMAGLGARRSLRKSA